MTYTVEAEADIVWVRVIVLAGTTVVTVFPEAVVVTVLAGAVVVTVAPGAVAVTVLAGAVVVVVAVTVFPGAVE